jgi:hypothetical protein
MYLKELFFLILLVIMFVASRRQRQGEAYPPAHPLQDKIDKALGLAHADEATSERTLNPASDETLAELEQHGIKLDRRLTDTEANHLLGLFQPPSARQIDILKHFRVPRTREMNKTLASLMIKNIFTDPANIKEWNQRPATARIKQGVLFMSGQLVSGMTQVETQSLLMQYGMENPFKYSEWKHIEKLFVAINDSSTLEHYSARKITWKRFFKLYDALKKTGIKFNEIGVEAVLEQAGVQSEHAADQKADDDRLLIDDMSPTA